MKITKKVLSVLISILIVFGTLSGLICIKATADYEDIIDRSIFAEYDSVERSAKKDYIMDTYDGHTYVRYDVVTTWEEAYEICVSLGGHLATATTEGERNVIKKLCEDSSRKLNHFWLGANDVDSEGDWKWITGEPFTYSFYTSPWKTSTEPTNNTSVCSDGEDYLEYYVGATPYGWNDVYGTFASTGFICEFEDNYFPSSVMLYNDHLYLLFDQSLSYSYAREKCEQMGGHLVTITDSDENDAVAEFIDGFNKARYWIGLDKIDNGSWSWVSGEEYNNLNLWATGEPTNSTGESCVQIMATSSYSGKNLGEWCDEYSTGGTSNNFWNIANVGFICEYEDLDLTPVTSGCFGGHYYELYDSHHDWFSANYISMLLDGYLISIDSIEEQAFAASLLNELEESDNISTWIDLIGYSAEGSFLLSDEDDSVLDWETGYPVAEGMKFSFGEINSEGKAITADNIGSDSFNEYFIVEYEYKETSLTLVDRISGSSESIPINLGYELENNDLSEEELSGFTLNVWKDKAGTEAISFPYTVTGPDTLYVDFSKYITLDANGGNLSKNSTKVYYGGFLGTLPTPVKQGYNCSGWYTKRTGGEKVTKKTKISDTFPDKIYARWTPKSYVVSYDANGGIIDEKSKTVSYGSAYGSLPTPTRSGYYFNGWKLNGSYISENSVVTTVSDHTLTAEWSKRTVSNITIVQTATKTSYVIGDALDLSGLRLKVTYSNGESEIITNGYGYSPKILTKSGSQTVVISYSSKECSFDVDVGLGSPTSVYINTLPTKTEYDTTETLNTDGLTLKAVYGDRTEKIISSGFVCSPTAFTREGQYRITVEYDGFINYFNVNIAPRTVSRIEVSNLPDVTSYYRDEKLDTTGLIVKAYCTDGYSFEISNYQLSYDFNIDNIKTMVETPVTVTYTNKDCEFTTSFNVNVLADEIPSTNILSAEDFSGYTDEIVTIPVMLSNNTGIMGYEVELDYDSEYLTPVETINGDIISNSLIDDNCDIVSDGKITIVGSGSQNYTDDGILFYIRFKVNDEMNGSTRVLVSGSSFDADYNNYKLAKTDFNINCIYEGAPRLTIGSVESEVLSSFKVPLSFKNAENVDSVSVTIKYDKSILEFDSANVNYSESNGSITINLKDTNFVSNFPFAYLKFNCLSSEYCTTEIECSSIVCKDVSNSIIETKVTDSKVTITDVDKNKPVKIYTEDVQCSAGSIVEVPIRFSNNFGFNSVQLTVDYDQNILSVSKSSNDKFEINKTDNISTFTYNVTDTGKIRIVCNNSDDVSVSNGTIAVITFKVSDNFDGITSINLSCNDNDIYNAEGIQLNVETFGSKVYSSEPVSHTIRWHIGDTVKTTFAFYGEKINFKPVVEEKGYDFIRWSPEVPETMSGSDLDFYAILEPIDYTVSFVADGKTVKTISYNIENQNIDEPEVPDIPYSFNGMWEPYDLSDGGDIVVKAHYYDAAVYIPAQKTVYVNSSYQLVSSSNFNVLSRKWSSDNESIVSVDSTGMIYAHKAGTCIIKVECTGVDHFDNKVSDTEYVKIIVKDSAVSATDDNHKLTPNERRTVFEEWLIDFIKDFAYSIARIMVNLLPFIDL